MGLKNMSLQEGAVSISATGGTACVFADDGITIPNGLHLIVPADADFQTRRSLTVKYRPPTLDPKTSQYTKDKKSMCLARPLVLADGRVVFNTIRIEREIHPSSTTAQRDEMNILGAQLLIDADPGSFWATGSMT